MQEYYCHSSFLFVQYKIWDYDNRGGEGRTHTLNKCQFKLFVPYIKHLCMHINSMQMYMNDYMYTLF